MSALPTMAEIARALPFASYSKRDGFEWWRPEAVGTYTEQFVKGEAYALALMESEGPREGCVSALGSILLAMVERGDARLQKGLLLGFASVLADLKAAAMIKGADPRALRMLYAKRRRDCAAMIAASGGGANVAPMIARSRLARDP